MSEVCPICSLPKDICVCKEISKERQRIRIRSETRKWGKEVTIIEGIEGGKTELNRVASLLKSNCACGGTVKGDIIILQGDHREKIKYILCKLGYPEESIEVQ